MTEQKNAMLKIDARDNVAVALADIKRGDEVKIGERAYTALEDIPFAHKMALCGLEPGEPVIKYGSPIGSAKIKILTGQWVHEHNLGTNLKGKSVYQHTSDYTKLKIKQDVKETFEGYRRRGGLAGTRNEIWIIPTVSCVNSVAQQLAGLAQKRFGNSCDGIYALPHNAGCSQLGDDFKVTQNILSSIVRHPNAGGVLLVSLGCENNNLEAFLPCLGDYDKNRIKYMIAQEVEDELEVGMSLIEEIAGAAAKDKREAIPVSELKIGFKCGGSDAFSGITANPLCGRIADHIASLGGTGVLTEVPEMFGAENVLLNRVDGKSTFDKAAGMIDDFKQYYLSHNQPVYENPSPGNKKGGITTLEEKSLGCIQKGGKAAVTDTLTYGQYCTRPGVNLMTGPGNDSVSLTNLLSAGVQLILFTTGRGNPLGTAVPAIKISSNTGLYERKGRWIDFNAGVLVTGQSMEVLSRLLWKMVIDVSSGRAETKNEINGSRDIMIFKFGVML